MLARGAVSDLEEITRYTNAQWGEAQCLKYISELEAAAATVARGQGRFKTMDELHPMLRMTKSGRHLIFCLPRENAPAVILAILHERMDMMTRLIGRLEE